MKTTSFNRRVRLNVKNNKILRSIMKAIFDVIGRSIEKFEIIEMDVNEITDYLNSYEKAIYVKRLKEYKLKIISKIDGMIEIIKIKDSKMIEKNKFIK